MAIRQHTPFAWAATLCCLAALCAPLSSAAEDDPREIVARADEVRFPQQGFQIEVTVNSTSGGTAAEARRYKILSKGNQNTLVQTLDPAGERGQIMLMKGRDLWVYMPNVSQPIRLPLSQRLTGQVANGDLARANFSGDYTPKLLRTDTLEGQKYFVLELNAVDRTVPYAKVIYWVHVGDFNPHRAEFYSLSDRLIKVCHYRDFKLMGGRSRPTKLLMEDALKKDDRSVLNYHDLSVQDIPDRYFTKDYLKKLE